MRSFLYGDFICRFFTAIFPLRTKVNLLISYIIHTNFAFVNFFSKNLFFYPLFVKSLFKYVQNIVKLRDS